LSYIHWTNQGYQTVGPSITSGHAIKHVNKNNRKENSTGWVFEVELKYTPIIILLSILENPI